MGPPTVWNSFLVILTALATIFIAVVARVVTDDLKEWLPWLTRRLIERAVANLPEAERGRLEEEWLGHLNELPGHLAKLYGAYGFLSASREIRDVILTDERLNIDRTIRERAKRVFDVACAASIFLLVSPLFMLIMILVEN